eukprot:TRINITY_DN386_c0_g1_i1.p1 TRINITY_DN386_c0_g1~~TRINITY_DN386_c0_g1_i1.p1  ORF type:complete len:251 (+),score=40.15 TRINITY_DN386_c0_g1_i1:23-754(+)
MKIQLFLLGAFFALVSAQYTCDVSKDGLLTNELTNPKTASFGGTLASGPGGQFIPQTTSSIYLSGFMIGEQSVLDINERNFGPNGKKTAANPGSVLDYSKSAEDSGTTAISFKPPVASVVVKMNYNPEWLNISNPTIVVYSENMTRLACYDIEALAPIRTPDATNGFAYIGVTTNDNIIGRIYFSGASMAYWDLTFDTVAPPVSNIGVDPITPGTKTPGSSSDASQAIAAIGMPLFFSFLYLF